MLTSYFPKGKLLPEAKLSIVPSLSFSELLLPSFYQTTLLALINESYL